MNFLLQNIKTIIAFNPLIQMKKEMSNEEFFKKYEACEKETMEDFIKRYSSTESELRETIAYLIEQGQMMWDVEIESLEAEAANLLKKLNKIELEKMLEEIRCFKEILCFQKLYPRNPGQGYS